MRTCLAFLLLTPCVGPAFAAPGDLVMAIVFAGKVPEAVRFFGRTPETAREATSGDAEMFERVTALLQTRFRGTLAAKTLDEAKAAGADLVAVVDIRSKLPKTIFTGASYEVGIVLLTPELQPIDTLRAEGSQIPRPPLTPSALKQKAGDKALAALADALDKSARLAEAAPRRAQTPVPPAAQAAAAAPAAPPKKSDVDAPAYKSKEDPDAFAMVVGIEKYASIPEARYAERDAAAVREHMRALGVPDRNIVFLTGPEASRAGLAKNLETWLPRNVSPRSTVFFYYSGHGAPDTRTGRSYLVPWDGDARFLDDTAYPVQRLYEKLGALKVKRVVAALDACFSGAGGRSVLPSGARPLVVKAETGLKVTGSLLVFSAAAEDEITGAEESQGHGLFTYHFLKGLSGEAADKDGRVSARGLFDYLRPKVQDAARRENRDQTPALHEPAAAEQVFLR